MKTGDADTIESNYKTIYDQLPEAVFISDQHTGTILDCNKAAEKLTGRSRTEIIGMQQSNLCAGGDGDEGKDFADHEAEVLTRDAQNIPVVITTSLARVNGTDAVIQVFTPVAPHKQADEGPQDGDRRFRAIVENSTDAILVMDASGTMRYDTPSFKELLGYDPGENLGASAFEFLHPEDVEKAISLLNRIIQTPGATAKTELRALHKDGLWCNVEAIGINCLHDPAIEGVIVNLRDITDRKETEARQLEIQEKFRLIFEISPQCIVLLDNVGNIVDINNKVHDWLSYNPDELIGKNLLELPVLTEESKAKAVEKLFERISGKEVGPYELEFVAKDGERHIGLLVGAAPSEGTQTTFHDLVMISDVTESKQAEQALRESEERLQALIENAPDAIIIADAAGNFIGLNRRVEEITGYSEEELLGKNFTNTRLFTDEDTPKLMEIGAKCLEGKVTELIEVEFITKEGSQLLAELKAFPVENKGHVEVIAIARDITERKQAEQALRESEERFREMADLLPQSLFETDLAGNFTYANSHALQDNGYSQEDIDRGVNALEMFPPEERERVAANIQKMLTGVSFEDHEYTIVRKDGTTFPALLYTSSIMRDGQPAGLRGIVLNITDRKQAEQALRDSEEKLRVMFESIADGIIIIDLESNILEANEAGTRMTGYDRKEELIGRSGIGFLPEEARAGVMESLVSTLKEEGSITTEHTVTDKDGRQLDVQVSSTLLYDNSGEPARIVSNYRDITERKQAEQALRQSEKRASELADMLPEVIFETDMEGNFTYINRRGSELVGYTQEDIDGGLNALQVFVPEDRPKLMENMAKALAGEDVGNPEYTVLRKDGSTFRALTSGSAIIRDNKVCGIRGIVVDITEREQAEEALRYRLELEELISTISTDFIRLSLTETDIAIGDALRAIGAFAGVDRSYIFQFSADGTTADNTHEWCAEWIEPQIDNLKGLPVEIFPGWMEKLNRFEVIYIPRVADLSPETNTEKDFLQSQGIQSLVVVPLVYGNSLVGFLGFDSVGVEKAWVEEDISLLKVVGEILANALERKRVEEALRESEERLKLIFNNVGDMIVLVDLSGTTISVNDKITDVLGLSPEEVLGRSFAELDLFDSEQLSELTELFMDCVSKETTVRPLLTVQAKHRDGHEILLEVKVTTVTDADGKLEGFLSTLTDVTERERAEQALRESEEKLKQIFNNVTDMIVLIDTTGNILSMNDSVERIFGLRADEVIGRNFAELGVINPDDLPWVANLMADTISSGQAIQRCIEMRGIHKDGHDIPLELVSSAAIGGGEEGKIEGLLATIRDVTERKRTEEELTRVKREKDAQLVQSAKLANLGEMATGIAHEINQPLNIIKLTCSGMGRSMKKGKTITPEMLAEELEGIDNQIERMRAIIDHMRTFARRSSDIKSEYTNMNVPLTDCFKFVGEQLRLREVEVQLDMEELPQVRADSNKLEQVFLNIIGNARDAMDNLAETAGPDYKKTLEVRSFVENGNAVVTFTDTGGGIPEKIRDRIFEPFFTTKEVGKGTGLGLSISYGILRDLDGDLSFSVEEGVGTTFKVAVPISQKQLTKEDQDDLH